MLQIQQLSSLHILLRVYIHSLQVLLVRVYALGENVDVLRFIRQSIAYAPY